MDSDLNEFIKKENLQLFNIQQRLSTQQRVRLLPKIKQIRFLLTLLKNENLTKKQQKDLEKNIDESTDKLEEVSSSEKERERVNLSIIRRVKPNIDSIDVDTRKKALMVKASADYETLADKDLTDNFLRDNDINFNIDPELSTKESLVLVNNENPNDIKISYRGSKMDNVGDWVSNAKILAGQEQIAGIENRFEESSNQIKAVKAKYGVLPNELLGTSRGGTLAITNGNKFGIDTNTFNPFIGKNLLTDTETSATHTVFRTTEDLASIGLGFKTNLANYKINSIRPLKDSVNPAQSHYLKNFYERKPRANDNNPDLLENKLKNMLEATKKHGEAQSLADASSILENSELIPVSTDVYNVKEKVKNNNENDIVLGNEITEDLYSTQTQNENPLENKVNKMIQQQSQVQSDIDDFRQFLLNETSDTSEITIEPKQVKKNIIDKLKIPTKIDKDVSPLEKVKSKAKDVKTKLDRLSNILNQTNPDLENVEFNEEQLREREERIQTKKALRLSRQDEMEIRTEEPRLDPDRPNVTSSDNVLNKNNKSLTDFLEIVSPFDVTKNPDGTKILSKRINDNSAFVNLWNDIDGNFTDAENDHLDSINVDDKDKHEFSLTKEEREKIYKSSPEERFNIVKDYENKANDAIFDLDNHTSIASENIDIPNRTITGEIAAGLNPLNLGIGIGAGYLSDKLVDATIGKKAPEEVKTLVSGGLSGAITEGTVLGLSGLAGSISTATIAPAALVGAGAGITGYETYKGLKSIGASDLAATTAAGATSGAVGGIGATVAGSALLGAEAGVPLDAETFGLASVVGAGIGSIVGLGSYLGSKIF